MSQADINKRIINKLNAGTQTFKKPKQILCVGMCVLDIITLCEKYPEEDSDKRCLNGYWQRGGNASNNVTVLRLLGANCEFLGMLSESVAFQFLIQDCKQRGIITKNCPTTKQDPPFSTVILAKNKGTRTIVHSNQNFPILTYDHFCKINLSEYSWIHFEARNPEETFCMLQNIQDYNKTVCNDEKIIVSVDLEKMSTENFGLAVWADYLFLGKDLAMHLGWYDPTSAVHGLRKSIITQQPHGKEKPAIICPWGSRGISCLDANDNYEFQATIEVENIIDSLGAGDTFCAATIFALSQAQMNLKDAVSFGNHCAGFKLRHQGYDAIKNFLKTENN